MVRALINSEMRETVSITGPHFGFRGSDRQRLGTVNANAMQSRGYEWSEKFAVGFVGGQVIWLEQSGLGVLFPKG